MVTRKNLKNPIKTIKIKSEKGKRSMFFTAANLYGELAWDLRDLPPVGAGWIAGGGARLPRWSILDARDS